jgi:metallo-beta-lactamase family protein
MRISIHGAAGDVTGSAYLMRTKQASVLVDFGMFQGGRRDDRLNRLPARIMNRPLDAVVLTHGHLDHVGRLPLLARNGFKGRIHATPSTIEMAGLILRDSARIQSGDLDRTNRKRKRAGLDPLDPLYTMADVEATLRLMRPLAYDRDTEVAPGVTVRAQEAGHMLGSVSLRFEVEEARRRKVVVFSGDIGPKGAAMLRDAEPFSSADLVFLESTYGDREHKPLDATLAEAREILQDAVDRKGKILIPAFAVGRVQQLLYYLAQLMHAGEIEPFPVFVDSPMAIEATRIYMDHPEIFDQEMMEMREEGILRKFFNEQVTFSKTADQSRAINSMKGPLLVLAGAGMCNAGRILHHLRQNLWRHETSVIIVGYQARRSLGRQLVDGAHKVRIFGEPIAVNASIHTLNGFSAHAGQTELIEWFGALAGSRPRLVLTHGEEGPRRALAAEISERYGIDATLPKLNESVAV